METTIVDSHLGSRDLDSSVGSRPGAEFFKLL